MSAGYRVVNGEVIVEHISDDYNLRLKAACADDRSYYEHAGSEHWWCWYVDHFAELAHKVVDTDELPMELQMHLLIHGVK